MKIVSVLILMYALSASAQDIDSICDAIKADSIARCASARAETSKPARTEAVEPSVDTQAVRKAVDSLIRVIKRDSAVLRKADQKIFQGQDIGHDRKLSVETRTECIAFLVVKKLRRDEDVVDYLEKLLRYNLDKVTLYRIMHPIVPSEDQYLCAAYLRKTKTESAKIQAIIDRLVVK